MKANRHPAALTADLGNSALKLAAWRPLERGAIGAAHPAARATLEHGKGDDPGRLVEGLAAFLDQAAASGAAVQVAALSSVAGPERTAPLVETLSAVLKTRGVELYCGPDHGLANLCDEPHTVGADRLFAARGALELLGRGCVVIDVGSAMTVDAVVAGDPDATEPRGRFLGGAIAPGPWLLAQALATGGAQLKLIEPRAGVPALGQVTGAALESGVVHGLRGAAFELARRVGAEAGLADSVRVVTGGARGLLLDPEPFWTGDLREDPDLVLRGVLAALLERVGA
ncbi:type III pantothenate kinase [Engelhardtia mirabilis]|uniref:Type III pantothenate kinase n=1 Tax=Engelhardtia mirabilis TaxID=2528011 RepID=A0A518BP85_9BACT|nr:Type III pantothenate kinase [Planctomycetes bacterium Pla133]QDV03119.1 Type III pantothenate kinase [Planctomycetes bacterium Pla86]